jgi:hypothetical protein
MATALLLTTPMRSFADHAFEAEYDEHKIRTHLRRPNG